MDALVEPIYGDSRIRSDLPPRGGAVSADFLATARDLIAPSPTLSSTERLELYHRQYWYRLLDSLAEDFPVLRAFLGETDFWRVVELYLEKNPPRDKNLRYLGAGLADFIHTMHPPIPLAIQAEELARLEYTICELFETGDALPLEASELAHAHITLQPHVRLLAMRTAAHSFWKTRKWRSFRSVHATPRFFIVVYRQHHHIQVEKIPKPAFEVLSALAKHHSLEGAMDAIACLPRHQQPDNAHSIQGWFQTWFERGWFQKAMIPHLANHPSDPSSDIIPKLK
jgi:hypothetical protein